MNRSCPPTKNGRRSSDTVPRDAPGLSLLRKDAAGSPHARLRKRPVERGELRLMSGLGERPFEVHSSLMAGFADLGMTYAVVAH